MHLCNSIESLIKLAGSNRLHLALGNFDGVHVGHQSLIRGIVCSAKESANLSAVVTFDPHPAQYFGKNEAFSKIDGPSVRRRLLAALGVDILVEMQFDEVLATMSAEKFLENLTSGDRVQEISVGSDFRFGKDRKGDAAFLAAFCGNKEIKSKVVDSISVGGVVASSSQIRAWIREGKVEDAARMLGRPFLLSGTVVNGNRIGRTIGFPTANISSHDQMIPGLGVYCGSLRVVSDISQQLRSEDELPCVINIGFRPTVNSSSNTLIIEAHIYDQGPKTLDLYGHVVDLSFFQRLRDEMRFESVEALRRQIQLDIVAARLCSKHIDGR